MDRKEKLAYGRGYNTGVADRWPDHRPPHPPHPLVAALFRAAQLLRDAVDNELATLGENDEWQTSLGEPLDQLDVAMTDIGQWLRNTDVDIAEAVEAPPSVPPETVDQSGSGDCRRARLL